MSQEITNPWGAWMDMSKSAWDFWTKSVQKATTPPAERPTPATPWSDMYDQYAKMMSWNPFFQVPQPKPEPTLVQNLYKQWEDGARNFMALIPQPTAKDAYERFFSSYQMFNRLQDFWKDYLAKVPTDAGAWQELWSQQAEQYQRIVAPMLQPFAGNFLPENLKALYDGSAKGWDSIQSLITNLFEPVVAASPELQELLAKAVQGDKDAYLDFMKRAADTYREVSSRVLSMPAMGSNQRLVEKTQKLVDTYLDYTVKAAGYSTLFTESASDAMQKLADHLMNLQQTGEVPQTFLEFYKVWSDTNEQVFLDLFNTDAFEIVMNDTIAAGSKLKTLYDDYLQDAMQTLPFPNRREMDAVEEEVYKLRNKVKDLEKQLKAAGTGASRTTRKSA
ncbi:MAG: hypothetical protein LBI33_06270 [Propionibacteriaceae bacterium]|jgi:class III poly(R)-hydroxyalkanoic acid synthase PhaE subunit|nr:hypothetical protein [Propionibacteriaceae bacterium]